MCSLLLLAAPALAASATSYATHRQSPSSGTHGSERPAALYGAAAAYDGPTHGAEGGDQLRGGECARPLTFRTNLAVTAALAVVAACVVELGLPTLAR